MEFIVAGCLIGFERGDITDAAVDAIVNAANPSLMGGGGVDGAIHRRGGPSILDECREQRRRLGGPLPVGHAVITTAGRLPARYVIHTVGPVWGADPEPEANLARAYASSLRLAASRSLESIAFPSISTGAYGFPVERAARQALAAVRRVLLDGDASSIREIRFILFSDDVLAAYQAAARELLQGRPSDQRGA